MPDSASNFTVTGFLDANRSNLGGTDELRRGRNATLGGNDLWYAANQPIALGTNGGNLPINNLLVQPFRTARSLPIDRIAFNVLSSGGAGSRARVGIYANIVGQGDAIYPGALLLTGTDEDATVAGQHTTVINPPLVLAPGSLFWFAIILGTGAAVLQGMTSFLPMLGWGVNLTNPMAYLVAASVYGALPDPFPSGSNMSQTNVFAAPPLIVVRGV